MPSFPWVFRYTEDVVSRTSAVTDRTILRPAMNVTMIGREEQSVLALVDSGSEHTLSGMGLARVIDVRPDPDREMVLGVGNRRLFHSVGTALGPASGTGRVLRPLHGNDEPYFSGVCS